MPQCTPQTHDALKRDPAAWRALQLAGHLTVPAGEDGPGYVLELRNCPACSSTIAIELPAIAEAA